MVLKPYIYCFPQHPVKCLVMVRDKIEVKLKNIVQGGSENEMYCVRMKFFAWWAATGQAFHTSSNHPSHSLSPLSPNTHGITKSPNLSSPLGRGHRDIKVQVHMPEHWVSSL